MSDNKCYVIYIDHIVYGTEVVGVCMQEPTIEQMQDLAHKYVDRYTFDENPDSSEFERKRITKIGYIISPVVC